MSQLALTPNLNHSHGVLAFRPGPHLPTRLPMPLSPEGLLQCLLVVCVLKFSMLPFEGPADSHRPNSHPSLRRLGCSERKSVCQHGMVMGYSSCTPTPVVSLRAGSRRGRGRSGQTL